MEGNNEEKINFISFFKENITLILLGLYSLSFVNYYVYYKSFEISIFNYIGLNDMLFFSLESIFKVIGLIFIGEIILYVIYVWLFSFYENLVIFIFKRKGVFYFKSDKEGRERIKKVFHKQFKKSLVTFKYLILTICFFSAAFLPNKLILVPTIMIYFLYHVHRTTEDGISEFLWVMSAAILIISTLVTTLVNSYNKRFEKDDYIISFYENSNFISTNRDVSCYNYLGETSSHIFLYDIENKESKTYFKDNVSELKIKNQNNIDKYIFMIKENPVFKLYSEMYNRKE